MRRLLLAASLALSLTACNETGSNYAGSPEMVSDSAMMEVMPQMSKHSADYAAGTSGTGGASPTTPPPATNSDNPTSQSFMAYRYIYSYFMPTKNVEPISKTHADMCLNAGPDVCQVLSYGTQAHSDDFVSAHLRIRGTPKWLETYKANIAASVDEVKGELRNSSVNAEDLTRAILDTGARLKAKKTLRTRLENHLETRDAKLGDLLSLERELARVQGEIESATSTLNVLRKRVSMSVVEISYQSRSQAVTRGTFTPVIESLRGFLGNMAQALSYVINFIAVLLPWLIFVILPLIWLLRWILHRRRSKAKS